MTLAQLAGQVELLLNDFAQTGRTGRVLVLMLPEQEVETAMRTRFVEPKLAPGPKLSKWVTEGENKRALLVFLLCSLNNFFQYNF